MSKQFKIIVEVNESQLSTLVSLLAGEYHSLRVLEVQDGTKPLTTPSAASPPQIKRKRRKLANLARSRTAVITLGLMRELDRPIVVGDLAQSFASAGFLPKSAGTTLYELKKRGFVIHDPSHCTYTLTDKGRQGTL